MNEKIGRNDPCLCGSGLKYKACCGKKGVQPKTNTPKSKFPLFLILFLLGSGILIAALVNNIGQSSRDKGGGVVGGQPSSGAQPPITLNQDPIQPASTPASSGPTPQPPGPPPPGKVWHAGHGHWHNAPEEVERLRAEAKASTDNQAGESDETAATGTPAPPGPPPPGKVWHAGHGHYHNAPSTPAISAKAESTEEAPAIPENEESIPDPVEAKTVESEVTEEAPAIPENEESIPDPAEPKTAEADPAVEPPIPESNEEEIVVD